MHYFAKYTNADSIHVKQFLHMFDMLNMFNIGPMQAQLLRIAFCINF